MYKKYGERIDTYLYTAVESDDIWQASSLKLLFDVSTKLAIVSKLSNI